MIAVLSSIMFITPNKLITCGKLSSPIITYWTLCTLMWREGIVAYKDAFSSIYGKNQHALYNFVVFHLNSVSLN